MTRSSAIGLCVALSLTPALVAQEAQGRITGRLVDQSGNPLPGVTIIAARGDEQRQAISGSDGRFELSGLVAGTYTVLASLRGFQTERRTLQLTASGSAAVDVPMHVSCIADTLSFTRPSLVDRRLLARSDLVVHLVLDARLEEATSPDRDSRSRYRATVLRSLTRPRNGKTIVRTIDVLLNPYADFEIGGEYVVWLTWRGDRNAFDGGYPIPGVVQLVEQGQVKRRGCGYSVDELFDIFEDAWENASR